MRFLNKIMKTQVLKNSKEPDAEAELFAEMYYGPTDYGPGQFYTKKGLEDAPAHAHYAQAGEYANRAKEFSTPHDDAEYNAKRLAVYEALMGMARHHVELATKKK